MMIDSRVAIEVIDSQARLDSLLPEWQSLLAELHPATPFQTPEWLLTWWAHFGSGKPRIFVFRFQSGIVGIMPCFLHQWNGRWQLTLMGAGISDYLDPVLDPRHSPAILDALASYLSNCPEWDICDFQDLSADTPLQALGPPTEDTPCSELAATRRFEDFLADRPRHLKRNLRYCSQKAHSIGTLQFTVSTEADSAMLSSLIQLHAARWQQSGEAGTIESNHAGAFLRDAAVALARQNMMRMFSLSVGGRVMAILLALRNDTTLFSYLTAFDPEYKQYGFGHEVLAQALRYAHENGYPHWNFLRGDESYKFDWGAEPIPKRRLVIQR